MTHLNVILLGPPGAGKGTQAALLCRHYHLAHLSTGDLLRAAIASQTDLGKQAKAFIEKGVLVPDTLVNAICFSRISEAVAQSQGILLDGYPRNRSQCRALDTFFSKHRLAVHGVLVLDVSENELIKRLIGRGRGDDTEDVIRKRLEVYHAETKPVVNHYTTHGLVHMIDGLGSVSDITKRLSTAIESVL